MRVPDGFSLEVPEFFSASETVDALTAFESAIEAPVVDSGLRRSLSSAEAAQPIQLALFAGGEFAIALLAHAGWAAIEKLYRHFHRRYSGRSISIELTARDDAGRTAEYSLASASDHAMQSISDDLTRDVRSARVRYDVAEGWLTWEEATAKARQDC